MEQDHNKQQCPSHCRDGGGHAPWTQINTQTEPIGPSSESFLNRAVARANFTQSATPAKELNFLTG